MVSARPFADFTWNYPATLPPAAQQERDYVVAHWNELVGHLTPRDAGSPDPPPYVTTPPVDPSSSERRFLRVTRAAIDTNGNGLPDWWELQHGYSAFAASNDDPRFADPAGDTDGDGLNNYEEWATGTNPRNFDTDGDLSPDGEEKAKETDPLSPLSTPTVLVGTGRLMGGGHVFGSSGIGWSNAIYKDTEGPLAGTVLPDVQVFRDPPTGSNTGFPNFDEWAGLLETHAAFPATMPLWAYEFKGNKGPNILPYYADSPFLSVWNIRGSGQLYIAEDVETNRLQHSRVWLRGPVAPAGGRIRTLLLRKELVAGHNVEGEFGGWIPNYETETVSLQAVTLTVPEGQRASSNFIDLVPSFTNIDHSVPPVKFFQIPRWSLLPVECNIVQGTPGSGEETSGNWLVEESYPIPEVTFHVAGVTVSANTAVVHVTGEVFDPLSAITGRTADAPTKLEFYSAGELLGESLLTSEVEEGQTFDTTVNVPLNRDGSFVLRAQTDSNASGLAGWDQAGVSVVWTESAAAQGFSAGSISLSFGTAPLATVVDTITVKEGGPPGTVLSETGANTGIYSGSITLGGEAASCQLQIETSPAFSSGAVDVLCAEIRLTYPDTSTAKVNAVWKETGLGSLSFSTLLTAQDGNIIPAYVETMEMLGSHKGSSTPFTVSLPDDFPLSDDAFRESARLKVGNTEFRVKAFTFGGIKSYYPYDEDFPDKPRLFLPSAQAVPASVAVPGFISTPEGSPVDIALRLGQDTLIPLNGAFTVPVPDLQSSTVNVAGTGSGSGGQNVLASGASRWREPGDMISEDDLLTAFGLLYGNEGQYLLEKFYAAGGTIEFADEAGDLDVQWWTRSNHAPLIIIEEDDAEVGGEKYTPCGAAHLLWQGLHQSLGSPAMARQLTTEDFQYWGEYKNEFAKSAAGIAVGATELYLSGLTIFSDGADLIIALNEAAEGNRTALIAALPFVSVGIVKYLERRGGKMQLRNANTGELIAEVNKDELEELAVLFHSQNLLDPGSPLVQGQIGPKIREFLTAAGGPLTPQQIGAHGKLREEMLKIGSAPSATHQAHHDLPWALKKEFAEWGFNVNDPIFGRWFTAERHTQIHSTEKYNQWWGTWIEQVNREKRVPTRNELLLKLAKAHEEFPAE